MQKFNTLWGMLMEKLIVSEKATPALLAQLANQAEQFRKEYSAAIMSRPKNKQKMNMTLWQLKTVRSVLKKELSDDRPVSEAEVDDFIAKSSYRGLQHVTSDMIRDIEYLTRQS